MWEDESKVVQDTNQATDADISEWTPGNRADVTHVAFHSLCEKETER